LPQLVRFFFGHVRSLPALSSPFQGDLRRYTITHLAEQEALFDLATEWLPVPGG
jgi:hypothetical protein